MTLRRQLLIPLGCVGIAALLGAAWGTHTSASTEASLQIAKAPVIRGATLEIEAPTPLGTKKDYGDKENCTTGCSLAKHTIAPFTVEQFHAAVAGYAKAGVDEPMPDLEKLLFYGRRTKALIDEHGLGKLPAEHTAFLKRELARQRAVVSIRMVDASGRVRVNLPPVTVPIGIKQHLKPTALQGQSMEINGTVMRTGLYHLWSRY